MTDVHVRAPLWGGTKRGLAIRFYNLSTLVDDPRIHRE
jgi:hypothetical protein